MKTFTLEVEIDGYINDEPYKIEEFEEDFHSDYQIDINWDELSEVNDLRSLDRWVWLLIREYSNDTASDGFPMFLFHITPEQISDVLGFSKNFVERALKRLIDGGFIKKYEIEGKDHIYAIVHS